MASERPSLMPALVKLMVIVISGGVLYELLRPIIPTGYDTLLWLIFVVSAGILGSLWTRGYQRELREWRGSRKSPKGPSR